jgi:hypothetical protein
MMRGRDCLALTRIVRRARRSVNRSTCFRDDLPRSTQEEAMRPSRLLALVAIAALPVGCSLITSYAGLGSGGAGGEATTTTSAGDTTGSGGQAGQGGATSHAGSGGGPTQSGGGGSSTKCGTVGTYCGGNGVGGDPNTLFTCQKDGKLVPYKVCERTCVITPPTPSPPPHADLCSCKAGGFYCGGDDVIGDPKSLYRCDRTGGIDGTFVKGCKSCVVVAGDDDMCSDL